MVLSPKGGSLKHVLPFMQVLDQQEAALLLVRGLHGVQQENLTAPISLLDTLTAHGGGSVASQVQKGGGLHPSMLAK